MGEQSLSLEQLGQNASNSALEAEAKVHNTKETIDMYNNLIVQAGREMAAVLEPEQPETEDQLTKAQRTTAEKLIADMKAAEEEAPKYIPILGGKRYNNEDRPSANP